MYEQVRINYEEIEEMIRLLQGEEGNVILVPTHRSYLDFLLVSYIMFHLKLRVPHICAGEDFLGVKFVHHILRRSGAFYMRRSFKGDPLYKVIFHTYVSELLKDGNSMEFFVEGTRSRTGKMLSPKYGILGVLIDNYYDEEDIKDLHFVPVSINYERVFEAESFPRELMGKPKKKESLSRLLGSFEAFNQKFGFIEVDFLPPISFKEYQRSQCE